MKMIGKYGTIVITAKRIVRFAGCLLYEGQRYQHDKLLPYVGQQVAIRKFEDQIEVWTCLVRVIPKTRNSKDLRIGFRNQTLLGTWICCFDIPSTDTKSQ